MPRSRLSLRGRLLILTVIALSPAAAMLGWTEFQLRRDREAEIRQLALRYGQLTSLEMTRIVDGIGSLLLASAQDPAVAASQPGACDDYLGRVAHDAPEIGALAVFDGDGALLCANRRPAPPLSDGSRALLNKPPAYKRVIVGLYQDDPVAGKALPVLLPLPRPGGGPSGALVAYLDLAWLGARIQEGGIGTGNSVTIADRDGIIIAREPFPARFVGTRIPPAFDSVVHGVAPGTMPVISQDGTRRMLGYYPVNVPPLGIYVSTGISEVEAFRVIDATRQRNLIVVLVAGAAIFALSWFAGERFIRRPVNRLLDCIQAWRRGDLAVRTHMQARTGELEAVGEAFDRMLDELSLRQAAREAAEAQRQLLVDELTHRVKNTLALAQAIASQSLRGAGDIGAVREVFQSRLRALADAHDVLTANNWEAADLHDMLERTLRPYRDGLADRFALCGPRLRLQPRATLALGLAVHELATNAVKYGSLAAENGRVRLTWAVEGDGADARFVMDWIERGGPEIAAPARTGFGSRLIQSALGAELRGTARMQFAAEGLTCRVEAPLPAVAAAMAES